MDASYEAGWEDGYAKRASLEDGLAEIPPAGLAELAVAAMADLLEHHRWTTVELGELVELANGRAG